MLSSKFLSVCAGELDMTCTGCDSFEEDGNVAYYCRDVPQVLFFQCVAQESAFLRWSITPSISEITLDREDYRGCMDSGDATCMIVDPPVTVWVEKLVGNNFVSLLRLSITDLQAISEETVTVTCLNQIDSKSFTVKPMGKY